jgi:general nucleoside transport system ATP-binding protein
MKINSYLFNLINNKKLMTIVEFSSVTKIFNGKILANNKINLKIKKGLIHSIIGENGSGKTTLVSVLYGIYKPEEGEIKINGKKEDIKNSLFAKKLKINMVHQHFQLIDEMTVLENIILGNEPKKFFWLIDYQKAKEKINKILKKYNFNINLNKKVSEISIEAKQKLEIIKVIYNEAEIIIFDEPTAILTPQEIKNLFEIIRNLKKEKKTIIFISHKLNEVNEISDEITILRNGKLIETFKKNERKNDEIIKLMVGKEINFYKRKEEFIKNEKKEILLEVKELNLNKNNIHPLKNISFSIKKGEIVAIAGIENNGQEELINSIIGIIKPTSGTIKYKNREITNLSTKKRYQLGISYIPGDRHKYAIILDENLINNSILTSINSDSFSKFNFLKKNSIQKHCQTLIKNFDVKNAQSGFSIIKNLSGGNQQKFVIGREISRNHELLIIVNPTRGIDILAAENIYQNIINEKKKEKAILIISYELSEIMNLADKIIVLSNGIIAQKIINNQKLTKEFIGNFMLKSNDNVT